MHLFTSALIGLLKDQRSCVAKTALMVATAVTIGYIATGSLDGVYSFAVMVASICVLVAVAVLVPAGMAAIAVYTPLRLVVEQPETLEYEKSYRQIINALNQLEVPTDGELHRFDHLDSSGYVDIIRHSLDVATIHVECIERFYFVKIEYATCEPLSRDTHHLQNGIGAVKSSDSLSELELFRAAAEELDELIAILHRCL